MVIFVDFIKISSNPSSNEHERPMKEAKKNKTVVFDECATCMKISKSIHDFKILTIAIQIKYPHTASSSSAPPPFHLLSNLLFLLCSRLRPRSRYLLRLRPRLCLCFRHCVLLKGQANFSTMNGNAREACNNQSTRLKHNKRIIKVLCSNLNNEGQSFNSASQVSKRHIK